jgi:hypothetical protein
MDKFLRRLKYYGIGFGIGIIAVFLIFGNRACNWGPKQRIKTSINDRVIVINSFNDSIRKSKDISDSRLLNLIQEGDIIFNESKTKNPLKVYHFESDGIEFNVTIPENSFISEVKFKPTNAKSTMNSKNGFGRILKFPKERNLIYYDENNSDLDSVVQSLGCQNSEQLFGLVKKSGRINFNKSSLHNPNKLNHVLTVSSTNNKSADISSIWYKEKIEIIHIEVHD